jgi:hypothetical protein
MKTIGLLRKLRHGGGPLVNWVFTFAAATYNLVRFRRDCRLVAPAAVRDHEEPHGRPAPMNVMNPTNPRGVLPGAGRFCWPGARRAASHHGSRSDLQTLHE